MASRSELQRWSEALAGIARTGLAFSDVEYERERFAEVLAVAADIAVAARNGGAENGGAGNGGAGNGGAGNGGGNDSGAGNGDGAGVEELIEAWSALVVSGVDGYATPKVAVGAVVANEQGQLLLIKRSDHGIWLYPTGWADVGYSPAEVAVKEVAEETGIECEVERLIACYDGLRRGFSPVPLYSLVFLCRATGGELRPHPLECDDVGWFDPDGLPDPLASGGAWVEHAVASMGDDPPPAVFDEPRLEVWRSA